VCVCVRARASVCKGRSVPLNIHRVQTNIKLFHVILKWPVSMAERSKASTVFLRPLEHWDLMFESCSGYGCLSASFFVVLSCVGTGLALD
jgi:hypothetical protein